MYWNIICLGILIVYFQLYICTHGLKSDNYDKYECDICEQHKH